MPLHLLPLALTILAVLVLGVIAVISSTSGGADWLQRLWKGDAAAPDQGNGRNRAQDVDSGSDGFAGAADPLRNAVEGRDGGHGAEPGGFARHPVDDA